MIGVPVLATIATSTPVTDQAKIACVALAVEMREARLTTNFRNYSNNISSAYATRTTALARAYTATTSPVGIKANIKTTWTNFKATSRTASKNWKTERNAAWAAYRTATKVCKAPNGVSDSHYSTFEPTL